MRSKGTLALLRMRPRLSTSPKLPPRIRGRARAAGHTARAHHRPTTQVRCAPPQTEAPSSGLPARDTRPRCRAAICTRTLRHTRGLTPVGVLSACRARERPVQNRELCRPRSACSLNEKQRIHSKCCPAAEGPRLKSVASGRRTLAAKIDVPHGTGARAPTGFTRWRSSASSSSMRWGTSDPTPNPRN